MSSNNQPVEINYDSIEIETPQAKLFTIEKGDPATFEPPVQRWIPRSQIVEQTSSYFIIPQWLAESKELV